MEKIEYSVVLGQAKNDLLDLQGQLGECLRKQEFIEARIQGLRQTVAALSKLLGQEFVEEDALGLTDAIRDAFRAKVGSSMTAVEVRSVLESLGYDISKYGNFMASVHTVIKRLIAKGEIREVGTRGDGKPVYSAPAPRL
jgi:hypothetical protein